MKSIGIRPMYLSFDTITIYIAVCTSKCHRIHAVQSQFYTVCYPTNAHTPFPLSMIPCH